MKKIIYFIEFLIVSLFFIISKLLGYRLGSNFGFYIGKTFGNIFKKKFYYSKFSKIKNLINSSEDELQKMY